MKPPIKTLVVEGESGDIFVVANGVKIAKRGHPGTPHAETWVPLEAGWTVIDCEGGSTIEVTYEGVRIHLVSNRAAASPLLPEIATVRPFNYGGDEDEMRFGDWRGNAVACCLQPIRRMPLP